MKKLIHYLSVIILATTSSTIKAQETSAVSKIKPQDLLGQVYATLPNTGCAQEQSKESHCIVMTVERVLRDTATLILIWFDTDGNLQRDTFGIGSINNPAPPNTFAPNPEFKKGQSVMLNGDIHRGNGYTYTGCIVLTIMSRKDGSGPSIYHCRWNNLKGESFEGDFYGYTLNNPSMKPPVPKR